MVLLALPNELLPEIIEYLRQKDTFALMQVSWLFYHLSKRHLLRCNLLYHNCDAFSWAVSKDDLSVAKALIKAGACIEHLPNSHLQLHLAARHNRTRWLRLLLELGADIEREDEDGRISLYHAIDNGHKQSVRILSRHTHNITDALVDSKKSFTALHVACSCGRENLIEFFLDKGLRIDAGSSSSQTPLHLAKVCLMDGRWYFSSSGFDKKERTQHVLTRLGEDVQAARRFIEHAVPDTPQRTHTLPYIQIGRPWSDAKIKSDTIQRPCIQSGKVYVESLGPTVVDLHHEAENACWSSTEVTQLKLKLQEQPRARSTEPVPVAADPFPALVFGHHSIQHTQTIWDGFMKPKQAGTLDQVSSTLPGTITSKPTKRKQWKSFVWG